MPIQPLIQFIGGWAAFVAPLIVFGAEHASAIGFTWIMTGIAWALLCREPPGKKRRPTPPGG